MIHKHYQFKPRIDGGWKNKSYKLLPEMFFVEKLF